MDAVVGVPSEDYGSGASAISGSGAIDIINDLYTGIVAGQAFDQNTTGVPDSAKGMIRSARLLTAYDPAAQLTWWSEFPSRTSEPQAMPAWSSSSPPVASALRRAPD